ncbi:hypothetical protein KA082_02110 [Candidatus Woesebacteria bacterium]|nr:hypothetical protein [Candidatus Woesebacteria bacterium]
MKKKNNYLIVLAIFFALNGVMFAIRFFMLPRSTEQMTTTLSQRAMDFITTQKKDTNSEWSELNFDKNNTAYTQEQMGTTYATPCFSVTFTVSTTSTKTDTENKKCILRTRVISPSTQLVLSSEILTTKLEEQSSIMLRKREKDKFVERVFTVPQFDQSLRFDEENAITLFLLKKDILIVVAFTDLSQPERITEDFIKATIAGITLH